MLNLSKKAASHEELFLERYTELISWSLQLGGYDRHKAEDLVHDAYIQWTLVRPDLQLIRNLDGYLYGMLRNMHAAELRRSMRHPMASLSVVEYDSALMSLQRASDEIHIARMQDQLRRVCDYACVRKATSKAGSLFLLRFFHGYYPGETARLAGIRRVTVDSWLRFARSEAKLYLENPDALKFIRQNGPGSPLGQVAWGGSGKRDPTHPSSNGHAPEFLDEIFKRIFQSCHGRCLSNKKLRGLYSSSEPEPLDCDSLAHIAACQTCLGKATKLLRLPPKSDRYPPDCLGRDPSPGEKSFGRKNGPRKTQGPSKFRLEIEDIIEHRPKELHIDVNGFTVGTQKVTSDRIEHSLKLSFPEQIGLVEVLSEQGIRLLSLYVEPPPQGSIEQSADIELSDGRALGVTLSFHDPWPNLELTYLDPHFAEVAGDPESTDDRVELSASPIRSRQEESKGSPFENLLSRLKLEDFNKRFWLRPGMVSAIVALVLVMALLLIHRSPMPAPAEVLRNATAAEASLVRPGEVSHRNITFEERRMSDGAVVARQKIEVWREGTSGHIARRLYDESGGLVAGAWQRGQSAPQEIFYNHGAKLKVSPPSQDATQAALSHQAWLLDPSATNFSDLTRGMESSGVETKDRNYVLHYRDGGHAASDNGHRILEASLVLDRTSLHAVSESLVIAEGNDQKELRFTETSFEQLPASKVDLKVFEPDAQLLESAVLTRSVDVAAIPSTVKTTPAIPPPTMAELAALEVNALYLLDQVNANVGEQIEVRRLASGNVLVQALIDKDERKAEILRALSPLAGNPFVKIDVLTIEEALKRQNAARQEPQTTDRIVINENRIPVYDEVHRFLERKNSSSSAADIDAEIQRFSGRMIDQSRQALQHAFALKHLTQRFSANDLGSLNDESRRKWHEMIRAHARAFAESSRALRRDLAPIFPQGPALSNDEKALDLRNDAALVEAVETLVGLASASDEAVSRAFALCPNCKAAMDPGATAFWRTFNRAENLANSLQRVQ
jgi:DNA-directed RNA polymerase specialized sigma24 family protein